MKLLGKDIDGKALWDRIEERLRARGLSFEDPRPIQMDGPEPRIDPLSFNLHALEEHADATRPMPLHTHRGGAGQAVLLVKWAFRKTCQVLINETLARQRMFNGHVRDAYAQLSAEVIRLRERVEALEPSREQGPGSPQPPRRRSRNSSQRGR
ncbi:MAG TPA: hypothetical protein VIG99_06820 [Myxococcaceae bacterium]|jgi:hypothetical protein